MRIPVSGTQAALQRSDAQTYTYGGAGPGMGVYCISPVNNPYFTIEQRGQEGANASCHHALRLYFVVLPGKQAALYAPMAAVYIQWYQSVFWNFFFVCNNLASFYLIFW